MPQKFVQEIRTIQVVIQIPANTRYTDQELCNLITIKPKAPKEIKVLGHHAEQTPA